MLGEGYARRKFTYNLGKTGGPSESGVWNIWALFTKKTEEPRFIAEIAVVYSDWVHTFEDDIAFFENSPDYDYIGYYIRDGICYHEFHLKPLEFNEE